jgi:hypothetical protein
MVPRLRSCAFDTVISRPVEWIPRLRFAPRGMTVNLRSSAESAVHSVDERLIQTERDKNRRDARILADQGEGHEKERPRKNAHNRKLLASWRLCVLAFLRLCVLPF